MGATCATATSSNGPGTSTSTCGRTGTEPVKLSSLSEIGSDVSKASDRFSPMVNEAACGTERSSCEEYCHKPSAAAPTTATKTKGSKRRP